MLDYNAEATRYDASRGGEPRADAAAKAIEHLLPTTATLLADVACGTAIVAARLHNPSRRVFGVELAAGMAAIAANRLPGQVIQADATRLPLADESLDAVTLVWLLHLLNAPTSAAVLAEAARVLKPGGHLITTVDKVAAAYAPTSDIGEILAPAQALAAQAAPDALSRIIRLGETHDLALAASTTFDGVGQGRSPRAWREHLQRGTLTWSVAPGPGLLDGLCRRLASLPDQDRPRTDPTYTLVSLTKRSL